MDMLFLQTTVGTPIEAHNKISLIALLLKGGWAMIPIALLFIAALYVCIERYLSIGKAANVEQNFMHNIKDLLVSGKIVAARDLCKKTNTPVACMMDKGITKIGKPIEQIDLSIRNVARMEVHRLKQGLASLAAISRAAPLVGALGTVMGLIMVLFAMSNVVGPVDLGMFANELYEALVPLFAGLVVGIIAYIGYTVLSLMVGNAAHQMDVSAVAFIDMLQEPAW